MIAFSAVTYVGMHAMYIFVLHTLIEQSRKSLQTCQRLSKFMGTAQNNNSHVYRSMMGLGLLPESF